MMAGQILADWREVDAQTVEACASEWRFEGWQHHRPLYDPRMRFNMPQPAVVQDAHNRVAMVHPDGSVKFHRIKPSVTGLTQCGQLSFLLGGVAVEASDDTPACKLCDH
jgi:hypothetical protein